MDKDLDRFLAAGLIEVPEGFAQKVMARVDELPWPVVVALPSKTDRAKEWPQWLALIGGAVLGVVQLSGFIFGIWAATAAG